MTPLPVSLSKARHLLLHLQGLTRPLNAPMDAKILATLIRQMGYVQLDSIRTVERAHHMILHTRSDGYRHAHLEEATQDHRLLFEHWTHDACLIPVEFYPCWRHRFAAARKHLRNPRWDTRLGPEGARAIQAVKKRIRKEGPLLSRDFEDRGAGAWWGWGPSKTALEYLWRTGDLAIAGRKGFEKIYDLSERVIPESYRLAKPAARETLDWQCRQALVRQGIATPGEIAAFWGSPSVAQVRKWIDAHLGKTLTEVALSPGDPAKGPVRAYAFKNLEDQLAALPPLPGRLRFLSPFDPVIRDRKRCQRLFGFDYRIEVFVPEKKRRYGYYVLPMLEGSRLTGRADLKIHRKKEELELKGLWLEPGIRLTRTRERAIRQALARLARFAGVPHIRADAALQRTKALPDAGP